MVMQEPYVNPKVKLKIIEDYVLHYNINRLYSYGDIISTFILIGGRGIGKSTGLGIKCIKNFRNKGEECAIIKRYVDETKEIKDYFDKIVNGIKIQGIAKGIFEYRLQGKRLGFGLALSKQQSFKSGINFDNVTTIIFEEAFLIRGSKVPYLQNEAMQLLELISTIVRKRKNYKVFIIGNNADIFNPYCEFFNVPTFKDYYIDRNRGLYVELAPTKKELLEVEKETPLYRLTKGTPYGDYHYNNSTLVTNKGNIIPKHYKSVLMYRLIFNNQTLNIYRHELMLYVEWRDKPIKDNLAYIIMENNNYNYYYTKLFMSSDLAEFTRLCYYDNNIGYSDNKAIEIFATFMEVIK